MTFLYLSQSMTTRAPYVITAVVTLEKLGWGFGAVGHMIYMMQQIAPGPYKTAHYTFATAFMGLCMMLTGMVSGVHREGRRLPGVLRGRAGRGGAVDRS